MVEALAGWVRGQPAEERRPRISQPDWCQSGRVFAVRR